MRTAAFRWITLIGMVLALILTVDMGIKVNNQDVSYEEVEARIVSTDKKKVKKTYNYEVIVEYKGERYELKNVRNEEFFRY